jgi:hypothetical protein
MKPSAQLVESSTELDPPVLDRVSAVTVHDEAAGIEILIERVTVARALKCPDAGLGLSPRKHTVPQRTVTLGDAVTRRKTASGPATVTDETVNEPPLDRVAPRTVADADSTAASIASARKSAEKRAVRKSIDVREATAGVYVRSSCGAVNA